MLPAVSLFCLFSAGGFSLPCPAALCSVGNPLPALWREISFFLFALCYRPGCAQTLAGIAIEQRTCPLQLHNLTIELLQNLRYIHRGILQRSRRNTVQHECAKIPVK